MWCGGFSKPKIMGGDRFIEKLVSTNSSQQDICIIGFQDAKKVEKSQSSTKRPLSFKQLTLFPLKDSKKGSTSRSSIKKRRKKQITDNSSVDIRHFVSYVIVT